METARERFESQIRGFIRTAGLQTTTSKKFMEIEDQTIAFINTFIIEHDTELQNDLIKQIESVGISNEEIKGFVRNEDFFMTEKQKELFATAFVMARQKIIAVIRSYLPTPKIEPSSDKESDGNKHFL